MGYIHNLAGMCSTMDRFVIPLFSGTKLPIISPILLYREYNQVQLTQNKWLCTVSFWIQVLIKFQAVWQWTPQKIAERIKLVIWIAGEPNIHTLILERDIYFVILSIDKQFFYSLTVTILRVTNLPLCLPVRDALQRLENCWILNYITKHVVKIEIYAHTCKIQIDPV